MSLPIRLDVLVLALAVLKLGVHVFAVLAFGYGYTGDELYYLACAEHLDWGYVDHPPLSIGLLWLVRALAGDSLLALRLVPALAGAITVLLVAQLARELGGGRAAERWAALVGLTAPAWLAIDGFYSMNALDLLVWSAAFLLIARLIRGAPRTHWLWLGAVLGLGLLNKLSVLWLGGALWVAVLATPHRRWLATPGPWAASALALLGLQPYLAWQLGHDWATLEFIRHGSTDKLLPVTPWGFLASQVVILGPQNAPVWLGGLVWLLRSPTWRLLGLVWCLVFGLLVAHGHVRAYYLAAAYPPLLAAGGCALERLGARWSDGRLGIFAGGLLSVAGILTAPLSLPLLPKESYLSYASAIGLAAPVEQREARGTPFPLHFAAQLSSVPIARAVAEAHAALPPEEQARVTLLAQTYTEAAAIDFHGRELGLPRAISYRNAYWTWGPGTHTGELTLIPADPGDDILSAFARCEAAAELPCPGCLSHISSRVYRCEQPRRPLPELWLELRRYQ